MRERLELDALAALYGADEVRKRLLALFSMGQPSINSQAYIIKSRVKDHNKLVAKVLNRRASGKAQYAPHDVTDIVGVRIITLHKDELATIVRSFLNILTYCHTHDFFSLFKGPTIKDTLFETIIYRTSDEADPAHHLVLNAFREAGLTIPTAANDVGVDVRVIKKPNQYSSIHVLMWCSRGSPTSPPLPVEIQIRTALEDIWGEIHHRLEYKRYYENPAALRKGDRLFGLASATLTTLKQQLDVCASTADVIKTYIQDASEVPDIQLRSVDTHQLVMLGLPQHLQQILDTVAHKLQTVYPLLYRPDEAADYIDHGNVIETLTSVIASFETVLAEYKKTPLTDHAAHNNALYYITMECALDLHWKARLLKAKALNENATTARQQVDEAEKCIKLALELYFSLENNPTYYDDPILALRIGEALAYDVHATPALEYYQKAAKKVDRLPDKHYMRVAIPRKVGAALWAQGDKIKQQARQYGNPEFLLGQRREYYRQAYEITASVLDREIDEETCRTYRTNAEREKKIIINNLLSYGVEYILAGGDEDLIASLGFTRQFAKSAVARIADVDRPTAADTERVVALYLGDGEREAQAARKVLRLLEERDWSPFYSIEALEDMRREAQASLKRHGRAA